MTPSLMSCLMTSTAVFFMREASSPTLISSGMLTLSCCFLATSNCRRCILSRSSWRRLALATCCWRCLFLFWIFSLPPRWKSLPLLPAILSNRSSYFERFAPAEPRVSTTRFSTTCFGCAGFSVLGFGCGCAGAGETALAAATFSAAGSALFFSSGALAGAFFSSGSGAKISAMLPTW